MNCLHKAPDNNLSPVTWHVLLGRDSRQWYHSWINSLLTSQNYLFTNTQSFLETVDILNHDKYVYIIYNIHTFIWKNLRCIRLAGYQTTSTSHHLQSFFLFKKPSYSFKEFMKKVIRKYKLTRTVAGYWKTVHGQHVACSLISRL